MTSYCVVGTASTATGAPYPVQFGDPTWRVDSTAAVQKAVAVCVNASLSHPGIRVEAF